ncbi:MAG TPA: MFS transporter [Dehalococcoidia bacterium]|nr:MFS transporter [Dehalococcoidia bacterium]
MVFSAAGILASHALIFYSFGIFLRPITEQFNWDRGTLSAAISIGMLVSGPFSIVAGRLSDRYGPRLLVTVSAIISGLALLLMSQVSELWHVYLIYGVALSVGGSGCVVPITTTIPRWFRQRRGTALGLTWTGIGLGGIIAPMLAQWLISSYDWPMAYIVIGIINLIVAAPLALTLKGNPRQMGIQPYGDTSVPAGEADLISEGLTLRQAIRTGRFWIFGLVMFCFIFIIQVMMAHIAPHAVDMGISATLAASIVSIWAAVSLIGRNTAGYISDRVGPTRSIIFYLGIMTLAMVWLLFAEDVWMFYFFAVVYGIAYGGVVPLQTLVTGELFGLRYLGAVMATLMLMGSAGGALGAPLAGVIFDVSGSYQVAFIICLLMVILAIILSVILVRQNRKQKAVL